MSAVGWGGGSYVAIYRQTTQQISAHTQKRFRNCHGHGHKGGTDACLCCLLFPPALPRAPCRPAKQIFLVENVNCKHIKIYC